MHKTPTELLASPDFKRLVAKRWLVSTVLTALLFVVYYGFILLVALNRPLMNHRLGDGPITLGIPLGVAVIVLAWALTACYVIWANRVYDTDVARMRSQLR